MFNGNCEEAMQFYASVLGGNITSLTRINDTPMASEMPPGAPNFVVNAQLELPGGAWLYGGDVPPHIPYGDGIQGVNICLNFPDAAEAERIYNALIEGGKAEMPFGPTFWAKGFGMLRDRFGVDWMVNGDLQM